MTLNQNSSLKILHILGSANFGGIEKLTAELVQLQSKDNELAPGILFSLSGSGEFSALFEMAGIELTSLELNGGYDVRPGKFRKARDYMSRFDILHIHSFNPLVTSAAMSSGLPILYTVHGGFGFGRKMTIADWIKGKLLRQFLNHRVGYVSFNSEFTQKEAKIRYGLAKVPQSVIYNGVNLQKKTDVGGIPQSLAEKLRDKFVVGTSSRFAGFKRIDRLIEGFAKFSRLKSNVVLLLVGEGVLRPSLESQVVGLNLEDQVIFTGYQSNVTAFQKQMDICVFPSQKEPFGLVAIEAYALGKPVIVFRDGGGLLETVGTFNQSDVVVNVGKLVERMQYYYDHPEEASKESRNRMNYAKMFDLVHMADKFKEIYVVISNCEA